MTSSKSIPFDNCTSFFIENGVYQGRFIRLNKVVNTIISKHNYEKPIAAVVADKADVLENELHVLAEAVVVGRVLAVEEVLRRGGDGRAVAVDRDRVRTGGKFDV